MRVRKNVNSLSRRAGGWATYQTWRVCPRMLGTTMEPHQPCVAATFALPMATMTSCPGTWKTSWGRLYPTVTGLRTEECPPSGKVSNIQAPILDPVVGEFSSTGSTSHA